MTKEHQKDLLLLTLISMIVLLTGLGITWCILHSKTTAYLQVIKFQLIAVSLIFALNGLVGCYFELKVILKYIRVIESGKNRTWPVNRILIVQLFVGASILGIIILFLNYYASGTDALLESAYYMLLAGVGFTISFGMMFVCFSIAQHTQPFRDT